MQQKFNFQDWDGSLSVKHSMNFVMSMDIAVHCISSVLLNLALCWDYMCMEASGPPLQSTNWTFRLLFTQMKIFITCSRPVLLEFDYDLEVPSHIS